MVKAKRIIYDAKTGESRVEEFEFTPPPPPPKTYVIYRVMRLRTGKEIRVPERFVGELTDEEITELEEAGWRVEEVG